MKVAIIVPIVGNFGRKGFYHSQEIGLGKELASEGNEVIVYKCVPQKAMDGIQTENHDGITIKYIPTRSFGPHGMFNVNLIESNTELVFAFADTQFIIPKLYRYCRKNNILFIPYVGIAHSFQQNLKSRIMDMVFKATTLQVYKKVSVITKTEDAKKELETLGVKHCLVAPVGMDFQSLKQDYENYDRIAIRKKWGFSEDDVIISFVARMQPEKHPMEMLEIFAKVNRGNKKLLMVGKGPLEEKLKQRAKELNIDGFVRFISEVRYDEMWQIHYLSDYFVNLRPEEIFGMAIMEAVYYKSCVVALRAPGPNTILSGMNGHFLCDTYDDVQDYLSAPLLNERELLEAKEKLCQGFSWSNCKNVINYTITQGRKR